MSSKRFNVMVVDDSVVVRKMVSQLCLEDDAIGETITAANGKIALNKIKYNEPDVILLDVNMPEMNGMETLEQLQKDYSHIPVVMFSSMSKGQVDDTFNCLAMGAQDFIAKPSNMNDRDEVTAWLKKNVIHKKPMTSTKILLLLNDNNNNSCGNQLWRER